MTHDLTTLLEQCAVRARPVSYEIDRLARAGERIVRRRRIAVAVGGGAAALVLLGGLLTWLGQPGGSSTALDPAGVAAGVPASSWAAGAGHRVALGSGEEIEVDDVVQSLYYTSAGVLVRTAGRASTADPDSTYSLVGADGLDDGFELDLRDRIVGTDPTLPLIAYTEATGVTSMWDVVLRDVRSGNVVTSIPVRGEYTWAGWATPPVSLSGDHIYVGLDAVVLDVGWRSGTVSTSPVLPGAVLPAVSGGRAVLRTGPQGDQGYRVVDAQSGATVAQGRLGGAASLELSPNGQYALLVPWRNCTEDDACVFDTPTTRVLDLDAGSRATVDLGDGVGWTPDDDLLRVESGAVSRCNARSGVCRDTGVSLGGAQLRLAGTSYEL